jgi:hypothetical protein
MVAIARKVDIMIVVLVPSIAYLRKGAPGGPGESKETRFHGTECVRNLTRTEKEGVRNQTDAVSMWFLTESYRSGLS